MSYEAIRWALAQPVTKSTAKFLLVAMADCVNADAPEMVCWPSAQHLCEVTGQDRKTVLDGVRRLREAGYIEDTKQRKGATGQIAVYRLQRPEGGPGPIEVSHYVYRLSDPETGCFYIGVRTCNGAPEHDTGYKGSGNWCQLQRLNGVRLQKEVVSTHPTRMHADEAEAEAIRSFVADPRCKNILVRPLRPDSGPVPTDPNFPAKRPEFPGKETRISLPTVPKTGHGTRKEPGKEPGKEVDARLRALPADLLADYLKLRTAKKAGEFTGTAIDVMTREGAKVGLNLEDTMRYCVGAGWQGFNAGWWSNRERPPALRAQLVHKNASTAGALFDFDSRGVIDA